MVLQCNTIKYNTIYFAQYIDTVTQEYRPKGVESELGSTPVRRGLHDEIARIEIEKPMQFDLSISLFNKNMNPSNNLIVLV